MTTSDKREILEAIREARREQREDIRIVHRRIEHHQKETTALARELSNRVTAAETRLESNIRAHTENGTASASPKRARFWIAVIGAIGAAVSAVIVALAQTLGA